MGDQRMGKKGFFTLSNLKTLLSKMLLNINPPLRQLERVPVRVYAQTKDYLKFR